MMALKAATSILVLPCVRSAHIEARWMAGAGKRVIADMTEKSRTKEIVPEQ